MIQFKTQAIIDKFYNYQTSKEFLPVEEATFSIENEHASMKIIPLTINIDKIKDETNFMMELYLFVKIK